MYMCMSVLNNCVLCTHVPVCMYAVRVHTRCVCYKCITYIPCVYICINGLCMCVLVCTCVHARVICMSYVVCVHNEYVYCVMCVHNEYGTFTYIVVGMHACVYVCIGAMCACMCAWICI